MMTREEILAYGLSFPHTYRDAPFHDDNWQLVRVRPGKKAFLWTYERDGYLNLNVKVSPEWRDFWRTAYAAVVPGWHQNKEHWNTIIVDGSIPNEDICRMIAESYDLVTDSPSKRIYEAVKKIPKGQVATYGTCCGEPQDEPGCGKGAASQSGSGSYPVLSRGQRKRDACRSICIWRRRSAGRAFARRWHRSDRWQGRSGKVWHADRKQIAQSLYFLNAKRKFLIQTLSQKKDNERESGKYLAKRVV